MLGRDPFHTVLNNINLAIGQGELFGLLGPNGAGKTTLIKILSTLILPSSGGAIVNGYDLSDEPGVKTSIGLASGDERGFYWRLTGRQNLEFFAVLHHIPPHRIHARIQEVLKTTALEEAADTRFSNYSSGMRQRLCIARALLNDPRILFLDEPTRALDPKAARELRTFIREELTRRHGVTVFLTTHSLEEAEEICDRIAILEKGEIKGCGTIEELKDRLGFADRYSMLVRGGTRELRESLLKELPKVEATSNGPEETVFEFEPGDEGDLGRIIDSVRRYNGRILRLCREQPSLWSIFSTLTQEKSRPAEADEKRSVAELQRGTAEGKAAKLSRPTKSLPGNRLARFRNGIRVAAAFIRRDFLLETSYRLAFFLHLLGIFFSVTMFYFISRLLGSAAAPYLASYGTDYFSFVLIGIAFYAYSNVGLTVFSNNLREAQTTGTLEAVLGTPTGIMLTVFSVSTWSFIFTSLDVCVYLLMGTAIAGKGFNSNYLSALMTLVLTITAMSSLGILAGSFILMFKRGNPVLVIVSNLSGLLSGVYYPVDVLPDWLKSIAGVIPITYSLDAMRKSLLLGASLQAVLRDLIFLALFTLIFLPLGLLLLRYAYNSARQDGSLTHY